MGTWFDGRLSAIGCVFFFVLVVACVRAERRVWKAGIFWAGWFVLLQLPTAHIVRQEAGYSERYVALAILAVPAVAAMVLERPMASRWRMATTLAAGVWIVVFAGVSFLRGAYYVNDASFCIQWENTNPYAPGPHDGFGRLAQERGEWGTAISEYKRALELEPNDATAHNNLANLSAVAGDFDGAAREYEWLMSHNSNGADMVATMTNYAQMLAQGAFDRNDPAMREKAHELLLAAIAMRPDYDQAHYILGLWDAAFGSREAAIRQMKIALKLHPDWVEVEEKLEEMERAPAATEGSGAATRD